jgi:DNA-binding MltR family transcriptional regulator
MDYIKDMRTESDRGCALVAAAHIDEALLEILGAHFVGDSRVSARLLSYPGPCSTLSARCDLVFCLGMFGKDVYNDIRGVIKIRNRFAHQRYGPSFDLEEIASACRNFNVIQQMRKTGTEMMVSARSMFLLTVGSIILALDVIRGDVKRRKIGPTWGDIPQPPINPLGY